MNLSTSLRVIQSGLCIYAVVYLTTALLTPAFHHRHLSLVGAIGRKASIWRIVLQGVLIFVSIGTLIYAAAYGIIAGVPYDWGSHDEGGEWSSTRDYVRVLLTVLGTLSFPFLLDHSSRSLTIARVERSARREFILALARDKTVATTSLRTAGYAVGEALNDDLEAAAVLDQREISDLHHEIYVDVAAAIALRADWPRNPNKVMKSVGDEF